MNFSQNACKASENIIFKRRDSSNCLQSIIKLPLSAGSVSGEIIGHVDSSCHHVALLLIEIIQTSRETEPGALSILTPETEKKQ